MYTLFQMQPNLNMYNNSIPYQILDHGPVGMHLGITSQKLGNMIFENPAVTKESPHRQQIMEKTDWKEQKKTSL